MSYNNDESLNCPAIYTNCLGRNATPGIEHACSLEGFGRTLSDRDDPALPVRLACSCRDEGDCGWCGVDLNRWTCEGCGVDGPCWLVRDDEEIWARMALCGSCAHERSNSRSYAADDEDDLDDRPEYCDYWDEDLDENQADEDPN